MQTQVIEWAAALFAAFYGIRCWRIWLSKHHIWTKWEQVSTLVICIAGTVFLVIYVAFILTKTVGGLP